MFAGDNFAFMAKVAGGATTSANDGGVWVGEDGVLRAIGREGEAAPGTNGGEFRAFTSLAMPGAEGVFFTAKLKSGVGGVTKGNDVGLWVWIDGHPAGAAGASNWSI